MWASLAVRHKLGSLCHKRAFPVPYLQQQRRLLVSASCCHLTGCPIDCASKLPGMQGKKNKTLILTFINTPTSFGDFFISAHPCTP